MNVELILYIFAVLIVCLIIAVIVAFSLIKVTAEIYRDRHFENKKEIDNLTARLNTLECQHNKLVDDQEDNNNKFVNQINKVCKIINHPEVMLIKKQ